MDNLTKNCIQIYHLQIRPFYMVNSLEDRLNNMQSLLKQYISELSLFVQGCVDMSSQV